MNWYENRDDIDQHLPEIRRWALLEGLDPLSYEQKMAEAPRMQRALPSH